MLLPGREEETASAVCCETRLCPEIRVCPETHIYPTCAAAELALSAHI